jgi:hypothetical protein
MTCGLLVCFLHESSEKPNPYEALLRPTSYVLRDTSLVVRALSWKKWKEGRNERATFSHTDFTSRTAEVGLRRFERSHIDGEAVLHIGLEQSVVGLVDFLDRDDFDIGGDVMGPAKVEHLLGFGDTANG